MAWPEMKMPPERRRVILGSPYKFSLAEGQPSVSFITHIASKSKTIHSESNRRIDRGFSLLLTFTNGDGSD
jgi:hypothetical protein